MASKREQALGWIRVAGYHEDSAAFTRLYIENRVSLAAAKEAFRNGRAQRAAGVPCSCRDCSLPQP